MAERFANDFATTLSAGVNSSVTTLPVAAAAPAALQSGEFRVRVGNEYMRVTAGAATTSWTVERGAEGSTAAAHSTADPVTHVLTAASLALAGTGARVFDAVSEYGLATAGTAAANTTAIHNALADAALVGGRVYIKGANVPYDVNQITIPTAPVALYGDGPQASVLRGAAGITTPVITYNPATAIPTGTGPFGSGTVFYRSQQIEVCNLGVCSYDEGSATNHGIYFPVASHGGYRLASIIRNVYVSLVGGTGIYSQMNGATIGCEVVDCQVYSNYGIGFYIGSDHVVANCHAAQTGYEGFKIENTNIVASSLVAYGCGWLTAARGIGFLFTGAGAGLVASALAASDCRAQGAKLTGQRVSVNGLNCQDNSSSSFGTYSGLELNDCSMTTVNGYVSGDREDDVPSVQQTHGLKVVNTGGTTNYGNRVQMVQAAVFDAGPMLEPVDTASDLNGTDVIVGGSGGGQIALPVVSTAVTPDPYNAQTQMTTLAANLVTVNAPANAHKGCPLRLIFLQNGTGGYTLPTFNSVYKMPAVSNTGNTANKRWTGDFVYDGTSWLCTAIQQWAY